MNSDDEDLRLAIALSIEEANQSKTRKKQNEAIIISSDEEDKPPNPSLKDRTPLHNAPQSITHNTFLSERAQLEAERLARSRRRMLAKSDGPLTPAYHHEVIKRNRERKEEASSDEAEGSHPPSKKLKFSASGTSNNIANVASSSFTKTRESDLGPFFWDGELRQTANAHVEPSKDTRPVFRLHDILGEKSDLSFAILSSYVTQFAWIYSLMPQDIPVVLVGQPDGTGASSVHNILPHWVKVTPHLRNGRGCMHVKSGRLRIVIATANLVDYDWRDIENSVWLQDIPLRKQTIGHDSKADDFPAQLERVLHCLHVSEGLKAILIDHPQVPFSVITDLREKWDFTRVHAQLIPSIAGKFEGWPAVLRVGHTRLMRAIRQIGASANIETHNSARKGNTNNSTKKRKLNLECQTSSIGSYTPPWIDEFYLSACGISAEKWLDEVKTKRSKRLDTLVQNDGWRPWRQIKILFPSLNTVRKSRLGEDGAGTMFCQRRQWMAPRFPRPLFHDSNSKRGAVLMHTKMILGTLEDVSSPIKSTPKVHSAKSSRHNEHSSSEDGTSEPEVQEVKPDYDTSLIGWLYVGSHNFTPSAWGNLSGTSFTPIMNIVNYELGVVIPLKDPKEVLGYTSWVRPPRGYSSEDEPWIQGKE